VYFIADPPTHFVPPAKIGLPDIPEKWEPLEGVKPVDRGPDGLKRAIELAAAAGIPTHVHSCGPESALVKILAEETALTVIDPLEVPPMGDCDLAELKELYGSKLTLKGNLHTTSVMLQGTPDDVVRASKQAIDDAAAGGLSAGTQNQPVMGT